MIGRTFAPTTLDDVEAWLEASPAIALAFAEEIGLAGFGVESLGRHWQSWAAQCEPAILPSAFFADRRESKGRLVADLRKRMTDGPNGAYAMRADSAAEAAAFVCAALLEAEDLSDLAALDHLMKPSFLREAPGRRTRLHPGAGLYVADLAYANRVDGGQTTLARPTLARPSCRDR